MTKPRRKPPTRFHAFLVEPQPGFKPSNWRQTPEHYRIVEYIGPKHFKGRADAWKFLYNHEAIHDESVTTWAIYLDFASPLFGDDLVRDKSHESSQAGYHPSSDSKSADRAVSSVG